MSSMIYCLFENTSIDLSASVEKLDTLINEEGVDSLEELEQKLNDYEFRGLMSILEDAKEIVEMTKHLIEL